MYRKSERFRIERLEHRIAPTVFLSIDTSAVGGAAQEDGPCFQPMPDRAARA